MSRKPSTVHTMYMIKGHTLAPFFGIAHKKKDMKKLFEAFGVHSSWGYKVVRVTVSENDAR